VLENLEEEKDGETRERDKDRENKDTKRNDMQYRKRVSEE
jgi:hypothetical protein